MKDNKHIPIIVLVMALISLGCLSLGVSYSFVSRSRVSSTELVISTGDLTSTVKYEAVNYMLSSMSDEAGVQQDQFGKITINKDNVYTVFYTLNIGYAVDSLSNGQSSANLLPMEYIKVALFSMNGEEPATEPLVGPVLLSDLVISKINTDNHYRNQSLLHFGTFDAGEDNQTYALKVWIDENTPEKYDESLVYLSLAVDQEPLVNKSFYNIRGLIFDEDGAEPGYCTIKVNHGDISTDNNDVGGSFYIENIPTGTYPLTVRCADNEYNTVMHFQYPSEEITENKYITNKVGQVNTYISHAAYTYYTTPGMILRANILTTSSNQLVDREYVIPSSHVVVVPETLGTYDEDLTIFLVINMDGTITLDWN